jgi:hypothetical protein
MKLTLKDCREHAKGKGGECLSEEYVNTNTKMLWKCSEHNHPHWETTFGCVKNGGHWCAICSGVAKLTIEECQEHAKRKGGECLSKKYVTALTKMIWKCSEPDHPPWETTFSSLKNIGSWCPTCSGSVKLTLEECQEYAKGKGGECLSEQYVNAFTKMLWKCLEPNHPPWEAAFTGMRNRGDWCSTCSGKAKLTLADCQEHAKGKGGKCLSEEYVNNKTNMLWKCSDPDHLPWEADFGGVKNAGHWCRTCVGLAKLTLEECQEHAKGKGGECLSEEYVNSSTKMLWKCSEPNHPSWECRFGKMRNRGDWCPTCSCGRSERVCREIIERLTGLPFPNKRPKFLGGLELDCYNEEKKLALEYQGEQHYRYIPFFHRTPTAFEEQRERDNRKRLLCKQKGVELIHIPYWLSYKNEAAMESYIAECLEDIQD